MSKGRSLGCAVIGEVVGILANEDAMITDYSGGEGGSENKGSGVNGVFDTVPLHSETVPVAEVNSIADHSRNIAVDDGEGLTECSDSKNSLLNPLAREFMCHSINPVVDSSAQTNGNVIKDANGVSMSSVDHLLTGQPIRRFIVERTHEYDNSCNFPVIRLVGAEIINASDAMLSPVQQQADVCSHCGCCTKKEKSGKHSAELGNSNVNSIRVCVNAVGGHVKERTRDLDSEESESSS